MPKLKGIVSQSVKEVLQSLVDDEKIDSDKIGSGNFFWAFPSKAIQKRKNHISTLEANLRNKKQKLAILEKQAEGAGVGRESSTERDQKLQEHRENKSKLAGVKEELKKYSSSDPKVIETKRKAIKCAWTQSNVWIDNAFAVVSYARKKRPDYKSKDILKYMQLPEELDYLPEPKLFK